MNLSARAKATRVSDAVAAGTSDINSDSVDMRGFLAAEFCVALGAVVSGAITSCKLQGSTDDSTWADLDGTEQTVADTDDDKVVLLDLSRPRHRYVRCVVARGTQNATVDSIVARQYDADREPVEHDSASVVASVIHHAPAEV